VTMGNLKQFLTMKSDVEANRIPYTVTSTSTADVSSPVELVMMDYKVDYKSYPLKVSWNNMVEDILITPFTKFMRSMKVIDENYEKRLSKFRNQTGLNK